jgi:catechol 2,3-dioxygenase-like lactoylglutathione lyase family enzyme
MLIVPADRWEATCRFYGEALGFEREYARGQDGAWLAGYSDGPTRLVLATPGVVGAVPTQPSEGALLLLETADPAGSRAALIARGVEGVGALQEQDGACFFELCDPSGNRVWCIRYPDESAASETGESSSRPKRSA